MNPLSCSERSWGRVGGAARPEDEPPSPCVLPALPWEGMRRKLRIPITFWHLSFSSLACRSLSGAAGWGHRGHFMDYMPLKALLLVLVRPSGFWERPRTPSALSICS